MDITRIAPGAIFCCIMVFTTCGLASTEREDRPAPRKSLYYMNLPNGLEFSIRSPALSSRKPQTLEVRAMLTPGGDLTKPKWVIDKITTQHYPPKSPFYYALVSVKKDRLFIFFTWNSRYCIIDKKSGIILKRGRGDDVLKQYDQFVLLKLIETQTWKGKIVE